MNQQIIDFQTAENNLLACAAYLAEKIKSSDGRAEAMKAIVAHYLVKNEVDTAAQFADSVEDSFDRDRLLIEAADKCAATDDDEDALQLADAIEDAGFQADARERIAVCKAEKFQFDKAFEIVETVDHSSNALGAIAAELQKSGDESRAMETLSKVEDAATKANFSQIIALKFNENGNSEKAVNLLEAAREETKNIETAEEKIRTLQGISDSFSEIGRKDKSIEVLSEAQSHAELLGGVHRNSILSRISVGFLQAGSLDLADRTLDLVSDKTTIASTLSAFASEFHEQGEAREALETLEEAYALLKSERDREIRDSRLRFGVFGSIAVRFAVFGKPERAIEIALENPLESERYSALSQIAQICVSKGKDDLAHQAVNKIGEESEKTAALIGMSDAEQKAENPVESLNLLREAYSHVRDIPQLSARTSLLNELAVRFWKKDETDLARNISLESLQIISHILDDSHKAVALSNLAAVYEKLGFELNAPEKDVMRTMLRRA